jgi:hypothetical protein
MTAHVPPLHRRALTAFLLVGLPILALGVVVVLALGQSRLRDVNGQHLEQVATQTAAAVDTYVYRRVLDVSVLGRVPTLRDAAVASSANEYGGEAAERRAAEATSRSSPREAALASPASHFLTELTAHDPIYLELLLTDRHGRLVAASAPTAGYLQSDQDWWRAAYGDGRRGRAILTDVSRDADTGRHAMTMAVPVTAPSGELVGILRVVADSREMLAMVGGMQVGGTGEAMLVRPDGSIVFSRRPTESSARFFAADVLREHVAQLDSADSLEGAYFAASSRGKTMLVGLAPSQLARSFPNVSWHVVVTQAEEELASPLHGLGWYLLLTFALTAIAILAFALWFSMQLARPVMDTDIHLVEHPPVMHVGETDDPIVIAR